MTKTTITQEDIEWIQRMQKQHGLPDSAVNYNQPWVDKAYQASVDAAEAYNKNPGPYGAVAWPKHPREEARANVEAYLNGQAMSPLRSEPHNWGGLMIGRNRPKWHGWTPANELKVNSRNHYGKESNRGNI